jgi:hypothetical protein
MVCLKGKSIFKHFVRYMKYLFLPFQLKNKACRFHSFIHSHVNVMFTTQNITTPRAMQ